MSKNKKILSIILFEDTPVIISNVDKLMQHLTILKLIL